MNNLNQSIPVLPAYLELIKGDDYKYKDKIESLYSPLKNKIKYFGQYKSLINAATREIKKSQTIMQLGAVYGTGIDEIAMAVGAYGQYDIIDINPLQVSILNDKYWKVFKNIKLFKKDAAEVKIKSSYDVVLCFMLLSEVPSATKSKIINNALTMVKPGGKVVFIDWHRPFFYHPLRYITRMYNRLYNPFVERLWDREIDTYADPKLKPEFIWKKSTYFGRMFQKLVATRKENLTETPNLDRELDYGETLGLADF